MGRSRSLQSLLWPAADVSLRRRRDGAIAVAAMFRTLTGRETVPAERAALLTAVKEGLDFDDLVARILSSVEAQERTIELGTLAQRRVMDSVAASEDTEGPRLLFLHIMKTGGTSLNHLLKDLAGPLRSAVGISLDDLLATPRPRLEQLRVIGGHIPYEAVALMPVGLRTVTVLRDPVSRTVSHYRELRRSEADHGHLSLDEFLSNERYDVPASNYQARCLAHSIDLAGAWVRYPPAELYLRAGGDETQPYPLQSLFDSTPLAMEEDELLQTATERLSGLDLVGVTDALDALAAELGAWFGSREPAVVPRLNVSTPDGAEEVDDRIRRRIEARNAVDRELYEQARSSGTSRA